MKPVSNYLYQYLKTNIDTNTSFHFTPLSRTFISTIIQKIHQANIEWNQQKESLEWKWEDVPMENKNTRDYEYIPYEIRKNWIDKVPKHASIQRKCSFSINGKTFHVYLWFPIMNRTVTPPTIMTDKEIEDKVQRTIRKIYLWLTVATSYISNPSKCSKNVNIYLYLTHHSKFLPNTHRKNIDQACANTAFTTGCVLDNTNIHIFREEEWFKVFMHETFHNLGLDFIDIDKSAVNAELLKVFPISVLDIRSYETYAELWAEIMNVLFVVFLSEIPKKKGRLPLVKWITMMEKLISIEIEFTIFQAKKVLHHIKMKYTDLFLPEKAKNYHEDTQVFAYYILKPIWMVHLNDFLEFCAKQPGGSSLKFQLSEPNLEAFIHKMKYLAKSDVLIQKYDSYAINAKEKLFANTTLRMTLSEIE